MFRGKGLGKTPAKGTFVTGEVGPGKVALAGRISKGGDLRGKKASQAGKMPKSM